MIEFEINNGKRICIAQTGADQPLTVSIVGANGEHLQEMQISATDAVTMLNWYQHQKATGNESLNF